MFKFFYKLYLFHKIPIWYRKLVHDGEIPLYIFNDLKKKANDLNKDQIKIELLKIQKENATQNKVIWNAYLEITLPKRYSNLNLNIAKKSNITAVIVEARKHLHFKVVVQNVMKNLQHLNACLNIYHGTENETFIKKELAEYKNINFINLNVSNLDIEAYNQIILSRSFWSNIASDKVLVFQTDTITFKPLDKEFLNYDYIGAPWKKHISKKNKTSVGNGGLSIRSKKMMLDIISQNIPRKKNMPEDVFLCQIIKKSKFKIAPFSKALEFSAENVFNKNAFGCHKIWKETTKEQLKNILK